MGARCIAVVPAYMAEDSICATIRSLLDDNGDFVDRVVVVASPGDGTARAARSMLAAYPALEVVEAPARLSAGAARNLGRARGGEAELLFFVDADCRVAHGAARILAAAVAKRGLGAASAAIDCDGGGLSSWLRHVLEFKEAAGNGEPPAGWMLPSTTLMCRAEPFDAVGGFPDLWPGEDLLFSWRLTRIGVELALVPAARSTHRHPRGWRRLLVHQYRLGFTSARARRIGEMPGAAFARHRCLIPALFAGRALRALLWFARYRRRELPLLLVTFPAYLTALAFWSAGFARAATADAVATSAAAPTQ